MAVGLGRVENRMKKLVLKINILGLRILSLPKCERSNLTGLVLYVIKS
ncbi:hypothetical protein BGP_6596 [Beggiatoa sp. PS]|nr:hypothetical protein BGP_6596 [Beggiatoa sp. PS]